MEKRLTAKNYFSVGMGLFGAALITALVTGYITYYSTNVLHITAMAIGNILLASRIFDGVTDLGMGVVLDKTNTKQGKARPWILRACIPFAVLSVLIFAIPTGWSDGMKIIVLFIVYNLYSLAYTALGISQNTLTVLVTDNAKERVSLTSVIVFSGVLGNTVFNAVAVAVILALSGTNDGTMSRQGFLLIAVILAVFCIIGCLLNYFFTKEIKAADDISKEVKEKKSVAHAIKSLLTNKYWLMQAGVQSAYFIGLYCRLSVMVYFAQYVLMNVGLVAVIVLADQLPSMIAMPIAVRLCNKFGKRNTLLVCNIISVVGIVVMMMNSQNIVLFMGGLIFRSIFTAPYLCTTNAFIAETADYGLWKNGIDVASYAFSIASFAQKIGQGLSGWILGVILTVTGFVSTQAVQSANAQGGISFAYIGVTLVITIIQIVLLFFYDLDNKMPQIYSELKK